MSELVLHVGMKKAGTSVLQHYLKENIDVLTAHGWKYPEFTRSHNHLNFAVPFAERITMVHKVKGLDSQSGRQKFIDDLGSALEQRIEPNDRWVMTSEFFSSRLVSQGEVAGAISFLRQYFDKITVVAFFRRQEFVLPSGYSQAVKDGGTNEWNWEFCRSWLESYDYLATYALWSAVVGSEHIVAIPYLESYKRDGLAVRRHFGQVIGVDLTEDFQLAPNIENRSLTSEGIELLRIVNPSFPRMTEDGKSTHLIRSALVTRVTNLTADAPKFVPDGGILTRIADYYRDSNAEFVRQLGGGQAWEQWLDQSFDATNPGSATSISEERLSELMAGLSEPRVSRLRRFWRRIKRKVRRTVRKGA